MTVWISATVGSSIVDTALVIADGNKMQGSAIPVKTPYVLSASFALIPKFSKDKGIETASILCKILRRTLLPVTGKEKMINSLLQKIKLSDENEGRWSLKSFPVAAFKQNKQAAISPIIRPKTAKIILNWKK